VRVTPTRNGVRGLRWRDGSQTEPKRRFRGTIRLAGLVPRRARSFGRRQRLFETVGALFDELVPHQRSSGVRGVMARRRCAALLSVPGRLSVLRFLRDQSGGEPKRDNVERIVPKLLEEEKHQGQAL
jgi:hypothetical protein